MLKIRFECIHLTSILKTNTNTNFILTVLADTNTNNLDLQTSESILTHFVAGFARP
jgi:hypothetical protein